MIATNEPMLNSINNIVYAVMPMITLSKTYAKVTQLDCAITFMDNRLVVIP
jgi:hypothetical protein